MSFYYQTALISPTAFTRLTHYNDVIYYSITEKAKIKFATNDISQLVHKEVILCGCFVSVT